MINEKNNESFCFIRQIGIAAIGMESRNVGRRYSKLEINNSGFWSYTCDIKCDI